MLSEKNKEKYIKAGKITSQAKEYAKKLIKPEMSLLEIAEKIEAEIVKLGGKPAFPVSLAINDEAAHVTPSYNDERVAHGLIKVDLGVHIDGFTADSAFTINLETGGEDEENKKLIKASEDALNNAINSIKQNANITLNDIGKEIQETIEKNKFTPIINLSGHSIEEYDLHSGVTIPNIENGNNKTLDEGIYAIEPFATNGNGKVYDGRPSGIYQLQNAKNVRSPLAREVLEFIEDEYSTLPFCSRWLIKKFGTKVLIALSELEKSNIIHHYEQLIESGHGKVSQAEHTVLIHKNNGKREVIVLTE